MLSLYLRTKKTAGTAKLYTRLRIDGKVVWLNLLLSVDVEAFNSTASDRELKKVLTDNILSSERCYEKLMSIELGLDELRRANELTTITANDLVERIVLADVRRIAEEDKERREKEAREAEERKRNDVKAFVNAFVASLFTPGEETKYDSTVRSLKTKLYWRQFAATFLKFYSTHVVTWDEIDRDYTLAFFNWLVARYSRSTVIRYFKSLQSLLNIAVNNDLRLLIIKPNTFDIPRLKKESNKKIYLSKEEIDALYNAKLYGSQADARDLLLLACFSGQRWSDASRIEKDCFEYKDGFLFLNLQQKKTGTQIKVPITDARFKNILERLDYKAPCLCDDVTNRNIRDVARMLAETTCPSLNELVPVTLTVRDKEAEKAGKIKFPRNSQGQPLKHRWQLLSFHTGRRTCATLMYLAGRTSREIKLVTGHTSTRALITYLVESIDEDAELLAKKAKDGLF